MSGRNWRLINLNRDGKAKRTLSAPLRQAQLPT
jgi:hypothetical protein